MLDPPRLVFYISLQQSSKTFRKKRLKIPLIHTGGDVHAAKRSDNDSDAIKNQFNSIILYINCFKVLFNINLCCPSACPQRQAGV